MKDFSIQTSRKNDMTPAEKGYEILKITEDDPLGRWGSRLIQEKLALKGIHITRYFFSKILCNFVLIGIFL